MWNTITRQVITPTDLNDASVSKGDKDFMIKSDNRGNLTFIRVADDYTDETAAMYVWDEIMWRNESVERRRVSWSSVDPRTGDKIPYRNFNSILLEVVYRANNDAAFRAQENHVSGVPVGNVVQLYFKGAQMVVDVTSMLQHTKNGSRRVLRELI